MRIKERTTLDFLIDYRYPIVIGIFLVLVCFRVHGLSLPVWDRYFSGDVTTPYVGKLRDITSDVWAMDIPQIMSQIHNGFPLFNFDLAMGGANAMLAHLPALEPAIVVGQPTFWGYYLFGVDAGTAWYYWFRILGLFLSGYEIIYYLTDHKKISLLGALMIVGAPATQWWAGHILPEILLYAQVMIASGLCYLRHFEKRRYKILALATGVSSSVGFVTTLSPSLQVPLGWMILIFAACAVWENRKRIRLKLEDVIGLVIAVALAVVLLVSVFWRSWDAVTAIMSTVTLGQRFMTGAVGTGIHLFYPVYQYLLPVLPPVGTNSCEASAFFPVWPAVLIAVPALIMGHKKEKEDMPHGSLMKALYAYFLFCLLWFLFRFPRWFARITMFSNVTNNRLYWTFGPLSIYLACYLFSDRKKRFTWGTAALSAGLVAAALLMVLQRGGEYVGFLRNSRILWAAGLIFIFAISFCVFTQKRYLFSMIALGCVLVSVCLTNPLSQGVSAITDKQISNTLKAMDAEDPDAYWLYAGPYPYGNFLSANGLNSFNATNFYMDKEKWSILDPDGENEEVYNRYCQVDVSLGEETAMEVLAPEHISVVLTGEDLDALGVDYVVSNTSLDDFSQSHGQILTEVENVNGVLIYQVNDIVKNYTVSYDNLSGSLVPAYPLTTGNTYSQTFEADGTNLEEIEIMFGTYARENRSLVHMEITGEEGPVYSYDIDCSSLADNSVATFDLGGVSVNDGEEYTITFSPVNETDSDFVTIYQSAPEDGGDLALLIRSSTELEHDD